MDFKKTIDRYRAFMYPFSMDNGTNWVMYHTSHRAAVKRKKSAGKKRRKK